MRLARHDLVWLRAEALAQAVVSAPCGHPAPNALSQLAGWQAAGRPFVFARQETVRAGWVRIGLPLPPSQDKRRLAFEVPQTAIARSLRPMGLESIIERLPPAWRPALARLSSCEQIRLASPRVFGSAAMQVATGLPYLGDDSDLDLLFAPADWRNALAIVALLAECETDPRSGQPRFDGEIVAPDGSAACWREIAGAAARILVKCHDKVELIPLAEFEKRFETATGHHGSPRHTDQTLDSVRPEFAELRGEHYPATGSACSKIDERQDEWAVSTHHDVAISDRSCGASRLHLDPGTMDRLALDALHAELMLEYKPGLVTPTRRGSHSDMDRETFAASIRSLRGYFGDCARLGALGGDFRTLQRRGVLAERAMFDATGGINTHKGAVFTLGLLCAAAGWQQASLGRIRIETLGEVVATRWGHDVLASRPPLEEPDHVTHGLRVRATFGLPGAREHAASGFPALFETTYPALRVALVRGLDRQRAGLHALLETMAVLPDTNLAHRGGIEGLDWARAQASACLAQGGAFNDGWRARMDILCTDFEARWLSPGGSADLLAAAWMLQALDAQPHLSRRSGRQTNTLNVAPEAVLS